MTTNPVLNRCPPGLEKRNTLSDNRKTTNPVLYGRPAGFQKPNTLFHSRNVTNPVLHRRPAIFHELYASFKRETVFRFVSPPILYVVPPFRSIILYFGKELNRLAVLNLLFEFVPCAYSALNANIAKENFLFFSFLRYFCLFLINFDMDFFVSSVLLLRAISTRIRTIIHTRFINYKQGVIFYE